MMISTPLDYEYPLSQIHLIEHYRARACVLLIRLHHYHYMANEATLIQVLRLPLFPVPL